MIETVQVVEYVDMPMINSDIIINGFTLEEIFAETTQPITEEEEGESTKVTFESRTSTPTKSDVNWTVTSRGGTNRCINITQGSVLPNCVGYAWGRWTELLGETHSLSNSHAEKWYLNTSDGYDRGQEPRVGAVICWSKGSTSTGADGYGHVAIVEEIYADGSILISESSYSGDTFTSRIISKGYQMSGQVFQGFIYIPLDFYTQEELDEKARQEEEARQAQLRYSNAVAAYQVLLKGLAPGVKTDYEITTIEEEKIEMKLIETSNLETTIYQEKNTILNNLIKIFKKEK